MKSLRRQRFWLKELESMGVEVHVDTERGIGLIGIIHGAKPGKAIALRADIDALPVYEHQYSGL